MHLLQNKATVTTEDLRRINPHVGEVHELIKLVATTLLAANGIGLLNQLLLDGGTAGSASF